MKNISHLHHIPRRGRSIDKLQKSLYYDKVYHYANRYMARFEPGKLSKK